MESEKNVSVSLSNPGVQNNVSEMFPHMPQSRIMDVLAKCATIDEAIY